MERDSFTVLLAVFGDTDDVPVHDLCLHLKKSLCVLRETSKLLSDWLATGLKAVRFEPSNYEP